MGIDKLAINAIKINTTIDMIPKSGKIQINLESPCLDASLKSFKIRLRTIGNPLK